MSHKPATALRASKIERQCPRCRCNGSHFGNARGIKNLIACSNCSHEWHGRVTKDETLLRELGELS